MFYFLFKLSCFFQGVDFIAETNKRIRKKGVLASTDGSFAGGCSTALYSVQVGPTYMLQSKGKDIN